MMTLFLDLLLVQSVLGAFDTLYHHEFKVALPQQPQAGRELLIHAVRALLYGVLFAGVAWYVWAGWWVAALVSLALVEFALTLWDFVIEDDTRLLPHSERITHTVLAVNGGAAFALLGTQLPEWAVLPTGLHTVDYGWKSWALSLAALGVAASGLRDVFAAWGVRRLRPGAGLELGLEHARVLVTGGTGFIGGALCRQLLAAGHSVTVITRRPLAAAVMFGGRARAIADAAELSREDTFDVVVNLSGAPVVGPLWTARRKALLLSSRVGATAGLLDFVRRAKQRPQVWIQASAVGYYGPMAARPLDERGASGSGFAAELCRKWEAAADVEQLGVRKVVLRFGLVLGRGGGVLPPLHRAYAWCVGPVLGNGRQRMSWIHIEDALRLIARAASDPAFEGIFNAVAPDAPTQREFALTACGLLHRPQWLRIPREYMTTALGEMAGLLVDGPLVVSARLQRAGFEFRFPELRVALMDLL